MEHPVAPAPPLTKRQGCKLDTLIGSSLLAWAAMLCGHERVSPTTTDSTRGPPATG